MNSLKLVFIVFLSSGIGGVSRYGIQSWMTKPQNSVFPLSTFIINIVGCLLIGTFFALSQKENLLSPEWRLALVTGFCGGFTTFSTFAFENLAFLRSGDYGIFILYTIASIILGILAVFAGSLLVVSLTR
ncbi:MAG: fluoride efflux transporter CrcB [Bacteroidetes bacterium]|nr:fluoride efflux transporter CrcB [Bacteroidota bacterium]